MAILRIGASLLVLSLGVGLCCSEVLAGTSFPASLLANTSARAAGMVDALTSLADSRDPLSTALNPAAPAVSRATATVSGSPVPTGLALSFGSSAAGMDRPRVFGDLQSTGCSYTFAPRIPRLESPLSLAVYTTSFKVADMEWTNRDGELLGYFRGSDSALGVAVAANLASSVWGAHNGPFCAGLGLAVVKQELSGGGAGFPRTKPDLAFAVSYGLIMEPLALRPGGWHLVVGASLLDRPFPFGDRGTIRTPSSAYSRQRVDAFPQRLAFGVAAYTREFGREILLVWDNVVHRRSWEAKGAVELSFYARQVGLSVRGGAMIPPVPGDIYDGAFDKHGLRWSGGLGLSAPLKYFRAEVDYAVWRSRGNGLRGATFPLFSVSINSDAGG
ncbi:MAG: hypothetical protein AB1505_28830 [Candidatus Latescibacterota bacterium]